jgi:hypothetical protein
MGATRGTANGRISPPRRACLALTAVRRCGGFLETSLGEFTTRAKCNGARTTAATAGLTVPEDAAGQTLGIRAYFATGYGTVFISQEFSISVAAATPVACSGTWGDCGRGDTVIFPAQLVRFV